MITDYNLTKNEELAHEKQGMVITAKFEGVDSLHVRLCHEWILILELYKTVIFNDRKKAIEFMAFVAQFYPEYRWKTMYDFTDPLATVSIECDNHYMVLDMLADLTISAGEDYILKHNLDKERAKALEFGEIVSNFLIRYLGYSIVGIQKQKIIITSASDCDKRFFDCLCDGYSLYRKSRVGYIKTNDERKKAAPWFEGYYYELPILPTKDIGVEFEENFEGPNNLPLQYSKRYKR